MLSYIVPVVQQRLGQVEIVEPAEEIRLQTVQYLSAITDAVQVGMVPFVDDVVGIIQRIVNDPYPEVKKESCKLVVKLCSFCPRQIHYHGQTLSKAILPALGHRHSAVRLAALQAIQKTLLVNVEGLNDCLPALNSLLHDGAPQVRQEMYKTAGEWLLTLPDRWSTANRTLPLLLAGVTDDVEKLRVLSTEYLDRVGKLFEEEWEDRVKGEVDFAAQLPNRARPGLRHLARENTLKIVDKLTEGIADWSLNTRLISLRILSSFLPLTEDQITGYTGHLILPLQRILCNGTPSASSENTTTSSSAPSPFDNPLIITKPAAQTNKPDAAELQLAYTCAKALGQYVASDVWLSVVLPSLKIGDVAQTTIVTGYLRVLVALLEGADNSKIQSEEVGRRVVTQILDGDIVCENLDILFLVTEILDLLVTKMGNVVESMKETVGYSMFTILVKCTAVLEALVKEGGVGVGNALASKSLPMDKVSKILSKVKESLVKLANAYGINGSTKDDASTIASIYGYYFGRIVSQLQSSKPEQWNKYSLERVILEVIVKQSGHVMGESDKLDQVMAIWKVMADKEREPEVRLGLFQLLLSLTDSSSKQSVLNTHGELTKRSAEVVTSILVPNFIWRPGRKASAVRRAAIQLFVRLISLPTGVNDSTVLVGCLVRDVVEQVFAKEGIWKKLLEEMMEDDELETRELALKCFQVLLGLFDANNDRMVRFDAELYKLIYQSLLKRMDDAQDSIRILTCTVLKNLWKHIEAWVREMDRFAASKGLTLEQGATTILVDNKECVEIRLDEVHWSTMIKGLAVHMDDTNTQVQEAVAECLMDNGVFGRVCPRELVLEHLRSVAHKHRSTRYIDAVLAGF